MAVEGADGVLHLAYELLLTNTTAMKVEVTMVQISDAALAVGPPAGERAAR